MDKTNKTIAELFKELDALGDELDAATPNIVLRYGDDPTNLSIRELREKLRPGLEEVFKRMQVIDD